MAPINIDSTSTTAGPTAAVAVTPIKNALNQEVEHAPFTHPELLGEFPTKTYDPIPVLPYNDRALKADPSFKNLLADATVTHLEPKIGTEISGLQLHELTDAQKDELALLVAQRGVVFFREQEISIEQQLDLGRYYGPLHVHQTVAHAKSIPQVHVVENSLEVSEKRLETQLYRHFNQWVWHSDVSYERQPPSYTSFKVLTTPSTGGDTLWASAYEVYERLTPHFKEFVEGLTAIHSSKLQAEATIVQGHTLRRPIVEFEHPVVRTHPVTGRKALYVNSEFTTRIKNLSAAESDAVLHFLTSHIAQGYEFQVRYHWTKDAVAIWDNRVTAHYATFDYLPGNRHAVRVTPHGEVPYFEHSESNSESVKHP
ncbi:putative alpha-ketoglutarate-dependent sulfonate dioxygenase [Phytophthora ramorum]|uniref:putative alpha-ketoglutarate-dependent sulfonate dioxygenase n=1 Tax=Phytophthora ramorum TaxID=164328 RepID=UPI0030A2CD14|nr:putative alpha-ketoglutarate-dependent sulfonate dioxygenase [Phytophthora ramorum]